MDAEVGLRDLRQNASESYGGLRRARASFVVTVSGRPAARLTPVGGRRWRRWDEVAAVLSGPGEPDLAQDPAAAPDALLDPFERQ